MKKMSLYLVITSLMLFSGLIAQEGYSVGLNVSTPIMSGDYFDGETGLGMGVVVGTPYSFDLGTYSVGVGGGIELANMGANDDFKYTGIIRFHEVWFKAPATERLPNNEI